MDDDDGVTEEDLAVPTDLLELHLELEDAGVTPAEFAEFAEGDG